VDYLFFSIYDKKAGRYMQPIAYQSSADAIRTFTRLITDGEKKTNLAIFPDDYALYQVGGFDSKFGELTSPEQQKPVHIIDGRAVLEVG